MILVWPIRKRANAVEHSVFKSGQIMSENMRWQFVVQTARGMKEANYCNSVPFRRVNSGDTILVSVSSSSTSTAGAGNHRVHESSDHSILYVVC